MSQLLKTAGFPTKPLLFAVHLFCLHMSSSELVSQHLDALQIIVDLPQVAILSESVHDNVETLEILKELVALLLELALERLALPPQIGFPLADDLVDRVHPASGIIDGLEVTAAQHGPTQPVLTLEEEPQPRTDSSEICKEAAEAIGAELLHVSLEVDQLELTRRFLDHVVHHRLEVLDQLVILQEEVAQYRLQQDLDSLSSLLAQGLIYLCTIDGDHLQPDLIRAILTDGSLCRAQLVHLSHVIFAGERHILRKLAYAGLFVQQMFVIIVQRQCLLNVRNVEPNHTNDELLCDLHVMLVEGYVPQVGSVRARVLS
mmetsp:Transcript_48432/g.122191  ORF Transcript_48432/g.122191 Transcript_48432/m.122191 type:complete len:316 (-) Transcript_48432:1633-2580(-)